MCKSEVVSRGWTQGSGSRVADVPDLYGQTHVTETPEIVSKALQGLKHELIQMSEDDASCLKQAMERCPEQLTDDFKLMFLRCEAFDCKVRLSTSTSVLLAHHSLSVSSSWLSLESSDKVCTLLEEAC